MLINDDHTFSARLQANAARNVRVGLARVADAARVTGRTDRFTRLLAGVTP